MGEGILFVLFSGFGLKSFYKNSIIFYFYKIGGQCVIYRFWGSIFVFVFFFGGLLVLQFYCAYYLLIFLINFHCCWCKRKKEAILYFSFYKHRIKYDMQSPSLFRTTWQTASIPILKNNSRTKPGTGHSNPKQRKASSKLHGPPDCNKDVSQFAPLSCTCNNNQAQMDVSWDHLLLEKLHESPSKQRSNLDRDLLAAFDTKTPPFIDPLQTEV